MQKKKKERKGGKVETRVGVSGKRGDDVWDVAARCGCSSADRSMGGAARLPIGSKPHLTRRQAEQTDSWLLSRREAHLEKLRFWLVPASSAVFWDKRREAFLLYNASFSAAESKEG